MLQLLIGGTTSTNTHFQIYQITGGDARMRPSSLGMLLVLRVFGFHGAHAQTAQMYPSSITFASTYTFYLGCAAIRVRNITTTSQ